MSTKRQLKLLAGLYGIQTSYYGIGRKPVTASPDALLATLRALGAPVETSADVPGAVREKRIDAWRRLAEPVVVAWDEGPAEIVLRLPAKGSRREVHFELTLEDGTRRRGSRRASALRTLREEEIDGVSFQAKRLAVPDKIPWGYHRLGLEAAGKTTEVTIISAPTRAYLPTAYRNGSWGHFVPLYAFHTERSWGGGDFSDLERLVDWTADRGAGVVSTLPFLAAFLEEPFDPSPYAPASRLFWNELYVDPTRTPEWEHSPKARKLFESRRFTRDLETLRSSNHVDYRRLYARKREILEELSESCRRGSSERRKDFRRYVEAHPLLRDYARFRATMERRRAPWPEWPSRLRKGALRIGDYRQKDAHYHLYAQWVAHHQVESLSKKARRAGAGLYLDLPLGVHAHGFDVWREQGAFVQNVNVGAPPDPVFTSGQDWGFHPLHPERSRRQGHRYWIGSIRHQLESAGLLRIDHVMGLNRLFWIPRGFDFKDGVYVRYPADELYAVLCLESHRNRSIIVGENLGIVPKYINRTMSRHNIQQMYLMQYSLRPDPKRPMKPIPAGSVASLNTHDTPLFAAFWQGKDIDDRLDLGLLDAEGALRESTGREARKQALLTYFRKKGLLGKRIDLSTVLNACLTQLCRSRAGIVLVNLEDLWLETEPQNVPGSGERRSNWARKLRFKFEELTERTGVQRTLPVRSRKSRNR